MEALRPNVLKEIARAMEHARADLEHTQGLILTQQLEDINDTLQSDDRALHNMSIPVPILRILEVHERNLREFLDLDPLSAENNGRILEIIIEKPGIFDLLRQFTVSRIRTSEQLLIALKELAIQEVLSPVRNDAVASAP